MVENINKNQLFCFVVAISSTHQQQRSLFVKYLIFYEKQQLIQQHNILTPLLQYSNHSLFLVYGQLTVNIILREFEIMNTYLSRFISFMKCKLLHIHNLLSSFHKVNLDPIS